MRLLYFGWVRQKLGTGEEQIELPATVHTLEELAAHLRTRGGGFAEVFGTTKGLRAAVNQQHANWEARIGPGDEVALFPPVTGG